MVKTYISFVVTIYVIATHILFSYARDPFEEYYKCIEKKNRQFDKIKDQLEAHLLYQGQNIHISCHLCLRPDQDIESYNIKWKRQQVFSVGEKTVPIDGEKFTLTPDKDLIIKRIQVDDAGQYFCLKRNEYEAVYQLDVIQKERRIKVVESGKGRKPKNSTYLMKSNLKVFTTWSRWSTCNKCNELGQRRKIGICTVKKIYANMTIKPKDFRPMNRYISGVPCRSTVFPPYLANLPAIKNRQSETLIGYCEVTCPTLPPIKNITDETGRVVEVVRSGEGLVSMKEGRPTLPPMVKRHTIYKDLYRGIMIECPSKDVGTKLVRWQNDTTVYNPLTIRRTTRGRVLIDHMNRLIIKKLFLWDIQPYSCWIDGRHVATIKIVVVYRVKKGRLKDYIIFVGFGIVALSLACVAFKVNKFRNSKVAR